MNDQDRLQQAEDNFNAGDDIYQALGVQQKTMRDLFTNARQSDCKHDRKVFGNKVALCLKCGKDVSNVRLNSAEKEELR